MRGDPIMRRLTGYGEREPGAGRCQVEAACADAWCELTARGSGNTFAVAERSAWAGLRLAHVEELHRRQREEASDARDVVLPERKRNVLARLIASPLDDNRTEGGDVDG